MKHHRVVIVTCFNSCW